MRAFLITWLEILEMGFALALFIGSLAIPMAIGVLIGTTLSLILGIAGGALVLSFWVALSIYLDEKWRR